MRPQFGALFIWGIPDNYTKNWIESGSGSNETAYNGTAAYINSLQLNDTDNALALNYLGEFNDAWNSTPVDINNPFITASTAVNKTVPALIPFYPAWAQQILLPSFKYFSITNYSNPALIHTVSIGLIGQAASITNTTFLQDVYDIGPTYTSVNAAQLANSVVSNGTVYTYPIQLSSSIVSQLISTNNKTMLMTVDFTVSSSYADSNGNKPLIQDVSSIRNIITSLKSQMGTNVVTYVTGDAAITADLQTSSASDMALIEPITIFIIIILMGILFRSVLGQFLPLAVVGIAIGLSQAVIFLVGTLVTPVNSMVSTLLFTVLMGVGTDYSIFIIMRYREERIKGATREEGVRTSITWAGESIVTSGATVIIAFFAMGISSYSVVQTMGLVLGLSIMVALLLAMTMIPSILMLVGNRIFWPTSGKHWKKYADGVMNKRKSGKRNYFYKASSFSVDHAKIVVIIAILISIPTAYVFLSTQTNYDFIDSMGNPESIQGMNALSADFGAGKIMPTEIVVTGNVTIYNGNSFNIAYLNSIDNITKDLLTNPNVQSVTSITRPFGTLIDYQNMSTMSPTQRAQLTSEMLQFVGKDNNCVVLTVVLKDQPESSAAVNYIPILRDDLASIKPSQNILSNSTILVGGSTAQLYDTSVVTNQQFTLIGVLVIVGIFVVLMLVLGSLLLPTFAIVSILMSITWSFALTTLLFGFILGKPILYLVPLILFVMLMGIGMDYNVFILTRIREEVHKGKSTKQAVVDAVDWTGGIITALALIMAGAFGSLMISSNTMLQEFGFALFVAVILDAMVVRTYVVPAVMALMGKKAWWAPGRLQREGQSGEDREVGGRKEVGASPQHSGT